jgi:phage shock protein A
MASLWQSIKNWWRGKTDSAAEALADPVRDAKFAIEDSEKLIRDFEGKVANLMAQNKRNEISAKAARADEQKWGNIAQAAAKAGNRQDCEDAVHKKSEAATKASRLEGETKNNEATIAKLRKTLDETKQKIEHARNNKDVLEARLKGAQVREELLHTASDMGGSGPLSALDDLERKTIEAETHADAVGELAGEGEESLEEKYDAGRADLQGEVDKLMSEHSKQ